MRRFPWQTGKQRGMDLETRINLLRCGSLHDPDADCQAMLLDNVDGQHSSDGVDGDGERTTGDDGAREREPFLWRSVPDECLMKCARLGVIPAPTALLYRRFPDPPIALPRRPPLRTSHRRTHHSDTHHDLTDCGRRAIACTTPTTPLHTTSDDCRKFCRAAQHGAAAGRDRGGRR